MKKRPYSIPDFPRDEEMFFSLRPGNTESLAHCFQLFFGIRFFARRFGRVSHGVAFWIAIPAMTVFPSACQGKLIDYGSDIIQHVVSLVQLNH